MQNPTTTTWGDLLKAALQDSGALGIGMLPLAEDLSFASDRGMWLLQQWERKRWLVYHLVTYTVNATGQNTPYTIGPTSANGPAPQISVGAEGLTSRPNRLEYAFFRQLVLTPNGPVDYPLKLLAAMEDYNAIRMKGLTNFSLMAFYDPAWPMGELYLWPWPQANTYAIGVTIREQLPAAFSLAGNPLAVKLNLPYEYYRALVKNIAMEVRPRYGIPSLPGDLLAGQAKDSLETLRRSNTAIPLLGMPPGLHPRQGSYNIYSDQTGPT